MAFILQTNKNTSLVHHLTSVAEPTVPKLYSYNKKEATTKSNH